MAMNFGPVVTDPYAAQTSIVPPPQPPFSQDPGMMAAAQQLPMGSLQPTMPMDPSQGLQILAGMTLTKVLQLMTQVSSGNDLNTITKHLQVLGGVASALHPLTQAAQQGMSPEQEFQLEQQKMQADIELQKQRMQADIEIKQMEFQLKAMLEQQKMQQQAQAHQQQLELKQQQGEQQIQQQQENHELGKASQIVSLDQQEEKHNTDIELSKKAAEAKSAADKGSGEE